MPKPIFFVRQPDGSLEAMVDITKVVLIPGDGIRVRVIRWLVFSGDRPCYERGECLCVSGGAEPPTTCPHMPTEPGEGSEVAFHVDDIDAARAGIAGWLGIGPGRHGAPQVRLDDFDGVAEFVSRPWVVDGCVSPATKGG